MGAGLDCSLRVLSFQDYANLGATSQQFAASYKSSYYLTMSFAQPITKDGFLYNGDLHVDVGNLNRHKRASIAEITAILRPDLISNKAINAQTQKDQVGHWYEAQLIHYGLPPSKDKARAKMRLLEALNNSKLAVPEGISKLEAEMKKEYASAERKAKAEYKKQMGSTDAKSGTTGKKRKQPEPEIVNNVNLSISFGPQGVISLNGTPAQQPSPTKKAKTATPKAIKLQNDPVEEGNARPKQTARRSTGSFQIGDRPGLTAKSPAQDGARKKQTAKSSRGGFQASQHSVTDAPGSSPGQTWPKQTARRSAGSVSIGDRSSTGVAKAPVVKKEPAIKKEKKAKEEPKNEDLPKLGLLNGYYDIDCPTIDSQWPDSTEEAMCLILTLDSPTMWGAYDFGMFSGIIRFPSRPMVSSNQPMSCKWRGQENGEGEMSFGDHCIGSVKFLGGGRIEGWLNLYGRCEFSGIRQAGPGNALRTAASMKQEWEGYSEETYEAAYRSRWD